MRPYGKNATCSPLQGALTAVEINISKAPHGGFPQYNWSCEPENICGILHINLMHILSCYFKSLRPCYF